MRGRACDICGKIPKGNPCNCWDDLRDPAVLEERLRIGRWNDVGGKEVLERKLERLRASYAEEDVSLYSDPIPMLYVSLMITGMRYFKCPFKRRNE